MLLRFCFSLVFVFLFLSSSVQASDSLVVRFEVGGSFFSTTLSSLNDSQSVDYVYRFAAGHASSEIPQGSLCTAIIQKSQIKHRLSSLGACPVRAKILKAFSCNESQQCTPIRGLYAGRSPS